ncbi:MAG: hypothetical protein CVV02_14365 [Firmicutes bacterium HGW-Firmicutes-7]|nr:MAG: hypothetical protein CVV02_14365 [Firmicutes bacterium HGW-Firmicutes-7]
MQFNEFREFFATFQEANTEDKIELYCSTVNLTEEQYMQLLRTFPPSDIRKLEKALY